MRETLRLEMYMEAYAEHGSVLGRKSPPKAPAADLKELIKMQQFKSVYSHDEDENSGGSDRDSFD